jgi:hypothetical protein
LELKEKPVGWWLHRKLYTHTNWSQYWIDWKVAYPVQQQSHDVLLLWFSF